MCGIGGLFAPVRDPRQAIIDILLTNENRGPKATGIYVNGRIAKLPLPASEFIKHKNFEWAMKTLDPEHPAVLCHCRFPTQGSELLPMNNHPIWLKDIVLVHNGHITWPMDDRTHVDTIQLLETMVKNKQEDAFGMIEDTINSLWGEMTFAAKVGHLMILHRDANPLCFNGAAFSSINPDINDWEELSRDETLIIDLNEVGK